MGAFFVRGLRLLRSNPRLFLRRVGMLVRHPVRNSRALMSIARRKEAVETSYRAWLETSPAPAGASWEGVEPPLISVLMPVHDVERGLLEEAIDSVAAQNYSYWQLCIADDASSQPHVREVLDRYAARDPRIRVTYRERSGHISAASNTALELASGEFVVLLDHDDVLQPGALDQVARVIHEHPEVDFIYSDEDKIDPAGRRSDPFFKPAWSSTLLTSCNYVTHLAAMRRELVVGVGGFRSETVGSQDHDLFLRVAERARAVAHLPRVLYSWRKVAGSTALATSAKPYAVDAARRALGDTVSRRGLDARVGETHLNGIFIFRYPRRAVEVSLIVDGEDTRWQRILDTPGLGFRDVVFLDAQPPPGLGLPVVPDIDRLTGEYLIWIDSGSRPARHSGVAGLIEQLQSPCAGIATGSTVCRGVVLQAGITLTISGQPEYAYSGLPVLPHRNFYLNLKDLPHEVPAGWVGCCAMRRELWDDLGGWLGDLPSDLALVDLCLRAAVAGFPTVYTPLARLERHDDLRPMSRIAGTDWPWRGTPDPFRSPNLSPDSPDGLPFQHGESHIQIRPARQTCQRSTDKLTN